MPGIGLRRKTQKTGLSGFALLLWFAAQRHPKKLIDDFWGFIELFFRGKGTEIH